MCGTFSDLGDLRAARKVADELLAGCFRLPVRKARDIGTRAGFDAAVATLAGLLRKHAFQPEQKAIRAVLEELDIDFGALSDDAVQRLIKEAASKAAKELDVIVAAVAPTFASEAVELARKTRKSVRQSIRIGVDFNALDKRIIRHIESSPANFIGSELARRVDGFSTQARRIVARGAEQGLGRRTIAKDLERAAISRLSSKTAFYWETLAGSFMARGRSFFHLSAFAEAGVDRYRFEAVLDERTTETCRFMHGKVFSVGGGLRLFERVEAQPDAIKELAPWVREATGDDGSRYLYVNREGRREVLATIARSGFGSRDDVGEFSRALNEPTLESFGVSLPPLHGLCRSTVLAVV